MQKRNSYLIGKAFRSFLTATVLSVAATQIANITSASLLGHLVGPDALAAANLSKPVTQVIYALSVFFVGSGTMLAGMAIGNGDRRQANRIFTLTLSIVGIIGLLLTVGGIIFVRQISLAMGATEQMLPMTMDYMRVILLGAIPLQLSYVLDSFVTVDGSPKLVTRSVIISNIANVPFVYIFVKIFGMGVAGAAWAMLLMYVLLVLLLIPHFLKKNSLTLNLPSLADAKQIVPKMAGLGLPLFLSTVLLSIQFIIAGNTAGQYLGEGGLVAWAVCLQMFSFSMIILTGTLRTIQPIGSILRGMDDSRGLLLLLGKAYKFMFTCLAVYVAALVFFPEKLAILLGVTNAQYLPTTITALKAFSMQIFMQAVLYVLIPVYQFYGNKKIATFLSVSQSLLPPLCFWLMKGNWWGFFVGQLIVAISLLVISEIVRHRSQSFSVGHTLTPYILVPKATASSAFETSVATNLHALSQTIADLRQFLQENNVAESAIYTATLCTEEFLKNIIQHGNAHYVDIKAVADQAKVSVSLHDDGIAFNPLEMYQTEEDKIGLGLLIARNLCKDVQYKYIFHQNMVTLQVPC